jgi:mannose-6-phosphate isomerase
LTGDQKLFDAVEAITAFIDDQLIDERAGGLFDCYPNPRAAKLQNPVMHMLEAFLALHEAWPDRGFLDRAGAIVHLFRKRLFQPKSGIIVEQYQRDWTAAPAVPGTYFEPGHQFEWAWLLRWYDIMSGKNHEFFEDRLWLAACERGMKPDGLCLDEVAVDPTLSKRTHRLWPHTEGIKAAIGRSERGDAGAEEVLTRLLGALNSNFLGRPFPAGWTDRVDPDGNSIIDMVPASTLYHLYSAFKETSRAATKEPCSSPDRTLSGRPQAWPL